MVSTKPPPEMAAKTKTSAVGPTVGSTDLKAKNFVSRKLQEIPTRKETADYKFFYENGVLKKYGKELSGDDITGKSTKKEEAPVIT